MVVEMLQRECDRQTARIGSEMRKHRRLDAIVTSVRTALRSYSLSFHTSSYSLTHFSQEFVYHNAYIWYNFTYNFVGLTGSLQA